ncbi:MAG: hypothetical protein JKY67_22540 [Pseudomonadales bacterium]|nr:hypothetical protein [Pseudomonadales bacterium]
MKFEKRFTITAKILLPMLITSAITLAAIVVVFSLFEKYEIVQEAELGAEFVIESLVIGTEMDASQGNVQRILAALAANKNIHRLP